VKEETKGRRLIISSAQIHPEALTEAVEEEGRDNENEKSQ